MWCRSTFPTLAGMSTRLARTLAACRAMEDAGGPVALDELARTVECSARQLQRDFLETMGIGPREYGQSVRTLRARESLRRVGSVTDAIFDAGYGSVRAFYEEAGRRLGMTPSEYASSDAGTTLLWSLVPSPVGIIIAVASPRGLCAARIGNDGAALIAEITAEFAGSTLLRDDAAMTDVMRALRALAFAHEAPALPLDVRGTAFQARVWKALQTIEAGDTRTYAEIASSIGAASSARAVASACAHIRVALAVPCHRVIRGDGALAGYAWGLEVKQQLLEAEHAAMASTRP